MKLLGLGCGSPGGNTEILLKAAMMGAEAEGAETEMVRLADLEIPARRGQPGTRDDSGFLVDKLMDCDALIISSPVYTRGPPGLLKFVADRALGPQVDAAAALRVREGQARGDPYYDGKSFDPRILKSRVAGFISLGGAITPDWVAYGLPLLHLITFPMHIAVVDQVQLMGAAIPGAILLDEAAMERARLVGVHVASQMGRSFDKAEYLGDEPGTCPVCHLDMVIIRKAGPECAVCGMQGRFEVLGGDVKVVFPPEILSSSILHMDGKDFHQKELERTTGAHLKQRDVIQARREPYDAFDRLARPQGAGDSPVTAGALHTGGPVPV